MARTCPNCGRQAIDDQSQFCNKCGSPFPQDQPKKVIVRTEPRLAAAPLAPPPPPPVAGPPAPTRPRVMPPAKKPVPEQKPKGGFLRFESFITRDFIRFIYLAGVIAIILISLLGIMSGFSKPASSSAEGSTAVNATSTGQDSTTTLIIWAGFLIFGNLFWRVLCEMLVVLFVMNDSLLAIKNTLSRDQDSLFEDEIPDDYDGGGGEFTQCPRCGKTVAQSELRTCSHCGVQGCSTCIRMMGLVRKTLTCRDCYRKK
jgi:hypothetical protein